MDQPEQGEETSPCKVTIIQHLYRAKVVNNKWDLMDLGNGIGLIKAVERRDILFFDLLIAKLFSCSALLGWPYGVYIIV